ncbi:hypothetical protein GCM10009547_23510 [Sporichthya brevicatena]|uniref:Uncharacterized protein n=1 Tax=Sporichthya brevicatena TaxID=171442 RepID=A0ABN1GUT5_9ACTN
MAACASVLTGTAMALPAATFADEAADTPPIAAVDLAGVKLAVPDLGVPLPDVEVATDELPIASVTDALGLEAVVDTAPEPAAEPAAEPTSGGGDEATVNSWSVPDAQTSAGAKSRNTGRAEPTAVAPPGSKLDTAAGRAVAEDLLTAKTQRQLERQAKLRAAQVLGTEKSAPATKEGMALAAPLTDLASRSGVDTLNLAAGGGPESASGDWSLMPEALYAVLPLLLAGGAVVAHGRRNARVAATSAAVVQRRRHASR